MILNLKVNPDVESFQNLKICNLKKKNLFSSFQRTFCYLDLASLNPLSFPIKVEICTANFIFAKQIHKSKYRTLNCDFGPLTSDVKKSILASTKQLPDTKYALKD